MYQPKKPCKSAVEKLEYVERVTRTPREYFRKSSVHIVNDIKFSDVASKGCSDGRQLINQYRIIKELGVGCQAKVVLCELATDKRKQFAMKIIQRSKLRHQVDKETQDNLIAELEIMRKLHHPYIVRLYEVINDPEKTKLYLIM